MPPLELREGDISSLDAPALVAILKDPAASEFRKAKACVRAGELGATQAVGALAALLADPRLSAYARYGLEPIADESATEALRGALPRLSGTLLIGVVNSLGKRRDAKAGPAFLKMMSGPDVDLALAATAALGSIGDAFAAKELRAAAPKSAGKLRLAIADASLVCAERLLADGKREEALDLYAALSTPDTPKPMRLAAMNAIIREETRIAHPR